MTIPNQTTIPNKLYFSISEVADLTGVKPHVLRYWESEFAELRPKKNRAGNRSYREKDIKMVLTIRDLLYQQGYTIQGARLQLKDRERRQALTEQAASMTSEAPAVAQAAQAPAAARIDEAFLRDMKSELLQLRERLR